MGTPRAQDKTYLQEWYDDIAFWRRLKQWRQEHPTSLFTAAVLAIAVLAVFAVALWFGLAWVLARELPWDLDSTGTTEFSVLRMVLFVLAGAVGVVGVVVAYRRQHSAEQGRFLEQLAEASRLLGDPNPTVQAAGVYALAGLADTEGRARRQQCVDVLCAYIRLPYAPAANGQQPQALEGATHTRTLRTRTGLVEEQRALFRPHDRHTRETIIHVITQHLRTDAAVSWSDLDFDFTGAVFDYGDFSGAVFSGTASFRFARFVGGTVDFGRAKFPGGTVNSELAEFTGGTVNFELAKFTGGTVDFQIAEITGGTILFGEANITGGTINFAGARITDGTILFLHAEITGGTVNFDHAEITGGTIYFGLAKFAGGTIHFRVTEITGGTILFLLAEITSGTIHFGLAKFAGGTVDFRGAKFTGGTVDFTKPRAWTAPPHVPWADGE